MKKRSRSENGLLLKDIGDRLLGILRDDRGSIGLQMLGWGMVVLLLSLPILALARLDGSDVKNVAQNAVDAASLAGANQYIQNVTEHGEYGEPRDWEHIVDEERAEEHALQVLFAYAEGLEQQHATIEDFEITFPSDKKVQVDLTIRYTPIQMNDLLGISFSGTKTFHAVAMVAQP